jgi:hypothetical protein
MDPVKCREMIGKAFANRPYPGDDNIGARNDRYPDYEGHGVARFFRGKDWRQITLETLLHEYQGDAGATVTFMVPEGFRYYLPAFLLMALEPESELDDSVMLNLTAPGLHDTAMVDRFRARVEGLSADERAAVICTLRCLAERYDREGYPYNPAKEALESYWEPG